MLCLVCLQCEYGFAVCTCHTAKIGAFYNYHRDVPLDFSVIENFTLLDGWMCKSNFHFLSPEQMTKDND